MERSEIKLPSSYDDEDLAILQRQITDTNLDVSHAVFLLHLDPKVPLFRKYLTVTNIAKLNPTVSRAQEMFDMFLLTLKSLKTEELCEIVRQLLFEIKKDDDPRVQILETRSDQCQLQDMQQNQDQLESRSVRDDVSPVEESSALDDGRALLSHNPADSIVNLGVQGDRVEPMQTNRWGWEQEEAAMLSLLPSSYLIYNSMEFIGDGKAETFGGSCIVFLVLMLLRFVAKFLFYRLRRLRYFGVRDNQPPRV